MNILNCVIEDSLLDDMDDVLIVQVYEVDVSEDWGDTAVGGDSLIFSDDDIEDGVSVYDVEKHPDRYIVEGTESDGYYIVKRT